MLSQAYLLEGIQSKPFTKFNHNSKLPYGCEQEEMSFMLEGI